MQPRFLFGNIRVFLYIITSLVAVSGALAQKPIPKKSSPKNTKKIKHIPPVIILEKYEMEIPEDREISHELNTRGSFEVARGSDFEGARASDYDDNQNAVDRVYRILADRTLAGKSNLRYVNPMIGTGGHGHTFPGAVVPFGMVQLSPDTRTDASWDGCGGYYYHDSFIYGFSHTHLSGTGVSDFGDILFQPITHKTFNPTDYRSTFSHENEKASPGYYSVKLDKWNVKAELTAAERVGAHRYTYLNNDSVFVVIDLEHRDQLLSYGFTKVEGGRVEGFRQSKAWANNQWVYFCAQFNRQILAYWYNEKHTKLVCYFGQSNNIVAASDERQLEAQVGISFTDAEGARRNMGFLPDGTWNTQAFMGWNCNYVSKFDAIKLNAEKSWTSQLNKIFIPEGSEKDLTKFYTAWYHCCIHPSLASDIDHRYRGRDQKIHECKNDFYSVFSLWDTYRALHPLLNVIEKRRTIDFINSFLAQYQEGGRLPVWELGSCETDCMIGYHAASVISDGILQGLPSFDKKIALEAMKHSSELKESSYLYQNASIPQKHKIPRIPLGYIDAKNEAESVSKSLEYAYNDYCIAQVCAYLNDNQGAEEYLKRSERWINSLDPESKFMRPRQNGDWISPFDPREVNNHFTEANSFQYSFYVPHDMDAFKKALGGNAALERKLDTLFGTSNKTTGREQSDISGLIGQYAHGNEPSHHMAYLYNHCDKPEKTQKLIQKIWDDFYTITPDGLIGNEDCGQMSAWAVMSAMGIYPVAPINQSYDLSKPMFNDIMVNHEGNGYKLISKAKSLGVANEIFLPQHPTAETVHFSMLSKLAWMVGSQKLLKYDAVDIDKDHPIFHKPAETIGTIRNRKNSFREIVPSIIGDRMFETDKHTVLVVSSPLNAQFNQNVLTRINVKNMVNDSVTSYITGLDTFKLQVSQNTLIWAGSYKFETPADSPTYYTAAYFVRKPNDFSVTSVTGTYNKQYTGGGDQAVVNGLKGSTEWRAGEWQGFQNQDIEYVIDLKKKSKLNRISASFLQDSRAWIMFPKEVEYFVSTNGKDFISVGTSKPVVGPENETTQIWESSCSFNPSKAKYIKVKAKTFGDLPPWHLGAPYKGTAFIFIDEITPELIDK